MMLHSWVAAQAAQQLGAAIGLLFTELNSWLTDVAGEEDAVDSRSAAGAAGGSTAASFAVFDEDLDSW
jgi:hypothetical protein